MAEQRIGLFQLSRWVLHVHRTCGVPGNGEAWRETDDEREVVRRALLIDAGRDGFTTTDELSKQMLAAARGFAAQLGVTLEA